MREHSPILVEGKKVIDDRGAVSFINSFNPSNLGIKRSYIVTNHSSGYIRAWHGHKRERKYVTVIQGAAKVATCPMMDFSARSVEVIVQNSQSPSILSIPEGYYNGFQTLTDDCIIQFFSTSTVEESLADDFRADWDLVDVWNLENYR